MRKYLFRKRFVSLRGLCISHYSLVSQMRLLDKFSFFLHYRVLQSLKSSNFSLSDEDDYDNTSFCSTSSTDQESPTSRNHDSRPSNQRGHSATRQSKTQSVDSRPSNNKSQDSRPSNQRGSESRPSNDRKLNTYPRNKKQQNLVKPFCPISDTDNHSSTDDNESDSSCDSSALDSPLATHRSNKYLVHSNDSSSSSSSDDDITGDEIDDSMTSCDELVTSRSNNTFVVRDKKVMENSVEVVDAANCFCILPQRYNNKNIVPLVCGMLRQYGEYI